MWKGGKPKGRERRERKREEGRGGQLSCKELHSAPEREEFVWGEEKKEKEEVANERRREEKKLVRKKKKKETRRATSY